jgi:hypothetical protein
MTPEQFHQFDTIGFFLYLISLFCFESHHRYIFSISIVGTLMHVSAMMGHPILPIFYGVCLITNCVNYINAICSVQKK